MAATNRAPTRTRVTTAGGGPAFPHPLKPEQDLRRAVLACMLFEGTFYESGEDIAARIENLSGKVSTETLAKLAIETRLEHNLRHVSLLLLCALVKHGSGAVVGDTIAKVVSRADELAELLALYWRNGKVPLAKQLKRGLALAFNKFDGYQLAKYNRDSAIKLRDVLFLCHAKPDNEQRAQLWKQLIDGTLPTPDTWETNLSAGADKGETFARLIAEGNLGYFALLRNLRNMDQAGVDGALVEAAIRNRKNGAEKLLPFRFTAAARAAPRFEKALDEALQHTIAQLPKLAGTTLVLVDVSGSMFTSLSVKSDMTRADAAATLASVVNAETLRVFSFSSYVKEVPARRGMAGVDAVIKSQPHESTELARAVAEMNKLPHDRLIVITDEQSTSYHPVPDPKAKHAYMINVASYKNGVGYGKWTHLDGFSERVLHWIHAYEDAFGEG